MVDPSLYGFESDSPSNQLMYETFTDFCPNSSGNMMCSGQKFSSSNNVMILHHPQIQQPFLQTIQFGNQSSLYTQDNSSLISPTVEELTFEDCCTEMLKLLDENDLNSLVDMSPTSSYDVDHKTNFQISVPQPEYIINNLYDIDDYGNFQENMLFNNNLTLAQINNPEFGLNLLDGSIQEVVGQPLKVMQTDNQAVENKPTFNILTLDQKIMSTPSSTLSGEYLPENLKPESKEHKFYAIAYSTATDTNQSLERKHILLSDDSFSSSYCQVPTNKIVLSSTLSPIQLKSILRGADAEARSQESSDVSQLINLNTATKQEVSESLLESYLLSPPREKSPQRVQKQEQAIEKEEDFALDWDICDEEEATSVNCDKKYEATYERPNTRKPRRHLDSETSVEAMSDDEDEASEFIIDLKNKDEGQRFFWQYNVLSKGPKGRRLCQSIDNPDPHILGDFQDPVFNQEQDKYKHNGKARRGDGNDVTPNPHKLFATGIELQKLNKQINMMAPGNDWPSSQKFKTLKERNKLASRACRLKKKAQHEANKLKLHGLKLEHNQLMRVISCIKEMLIRKIRDKEELDSSLLQHFQAISKKYHTLFVAGKTAEFVNSVLEKVASGDKSGGINPRSLSA